MHKFSEFATEDVFDGEKININSILNCDIEVLKFRPLTPKYNDRMCTQIQLRKAGEKENYILFTSSSVLTRQLIDYSQHLPFAAQIQKIKNYFTFV